ncbi:MAG TPA: hypothetical protein VMV05_06475 [bacterium]|nr:hypothetical protein [bacterium]
MKKLLVVGLAAIFTAAVAGLALADGNNPACKGKKCNGHHWHKKGAKGGTTSGATSPSK